MEDVGKEKISCVFLPVYSEAEDLGSSHVSLSAVSPSQGDWLCGTGQRASGFTNVK